MTTVERDKSEPCARVFDRLVEGREVSGDAALEQHLGSCMACFRVMSELRDAPRLAAALRQEGQDDAVAGGRDERFWNAAAERTVDAVIAALQPPAAQRPSAARPVRRVARVVAAAGLLAAAAMFVVFVGHRSPAPSGVAQVVAPFAESIRLAADEDLDNRGDVADLDAAALRRLVDRLREGAGGELAALAAGDGNDGWESPADDDTRVSDALAELDAAALVRVERSLAGSAL
jgi:hypothetical protein